MQDPNKMMASTTQLVLEARPPSRHRGRRRVTSLPIARRTDRAWHERAATLHDRVARPRYDSDLRLVLREAVLVAEQIAVRAQVLTTLLENVPPALTDLAPATDCAEPAPVALQTQTTSLSPREREVLALVAEGHFNKAIAAALFVSPNTIKSHVASLLTKLDADTRVQLAVIAASDVQREPC